MSTTPDNRILAQIAYRPPRWLMGILFLLACAGEVLFCYFASTCDRPGEVLGFRLTARGMRVFFGVFAGLCPLGLLALGACLFAAFKNPRRIALTSDSVILPKPDWSGLSHEEIEVPFRDLVAVDVISSGSLLVRLRSLHLSWRGGNCVLMEHMFPSTPEFDRAVALLQAAFAQFGGPLAAQDEATSA